ncbi:MAG: aldo/keto reductase [Bifidobacteriaceae bacterium]|jgi:aryl-alcohol dehydrogenase-like predicted oxidoreductase|nr:aldo/keto reductase [Bifidobacteriaceae bacterium]
MEQRILGKTGRPVSVIGLGCWQLGGTDWGDVDDAAALAVLESAVDNGINLFDTADVYGDGRSEQLIGRFLKAHGGPDAIGVTVVTKLGRRANPHTPEAYNATNFRAWLDRSRRNLGLDTIPMVQLHCPPTPVYSDQAAFDALDRLKEEGVIAQYAVSVETVAEALTAIAQPGVASIQIIFNLLRRKPLEQVLPAAQAAGVGILARVPLASGLLSGRYTKDTVFPAGDHRTYNRFGQAFDQGETFSGVPYEVGLTAAAQVADVAAGLPGHVTPAQLALAWIIQQAGVTAAIPGARNAEQVRGNAAAAAVPPLDQATLDALQAIYDNLIREHVHSRW